MSVTIPAHLSPEQCPNWDADWGCQCFLKQNATVGRAHDAGFLMLSERGWHDNNESTRDARCPYCGTTYARQDHTDTCPLGRLHARLSAMETAHLTACQERNIAESRAEAAESERDTLRERVAKLEAVREAAEKLTQQMARVYKSMPYVRAWQVAQNHLGSYDGPTWADEQDALDAALAAAEES